MTDVADTINDIETMDEVDLRSMIFEVDRDGPDPGPTYPHQRLALERIEAGAVKAPPVSGILHYPTGAGKTRVGMELIARALRENSRHRFIWATHSKNLIRQSMVRMAELSKLFPSDTTYAWASNADEADDLENDVSVSFMTRNALTEVLDRAGDGRRNHPWRARLEAGQPMTLIYDECHQLGADKLQRNWRKFFQSIVAPPGASRRPWRTIGLSATPVPTQVDSHDVLREQIFPLRGEAASTSHDWPFHVFHRVRNETLVQSGVLCPINLYLDRRGEFDLPAPLLEGIIGDARLRPPGADAEKIVLQKYALQFNSKVLAHPRVLEFLAERIGKNIQLMGKTIVFVPNIEAANRLCGILYERFPALRGSVAAVHSKMDQLQVPGQGKATVHEVLERFRRHEDRPSILVNVDMLTEGFDDPKIRSVVLARLTLSTNRFWQMIGRGTRGPATRGTPDCNVIDPVKLTRLYDYFGGYQPSFARDDDLEFEDVDEPSAGDNRLPPQVPSVERPPDPTGGAYVVDPELERAHASVALALRHFLSGEPLSEAIAIEAARSAHVTLSDGHAVFQPSRDGFESTTATALLLGEISLLERRAGVDLAWLRQQLPVTIDETLLKQRLRLIRVVESLRLWTEAAFAQAQMSGAFLGALQDEAKGGTAKPEGTAVPDVASNVVALSAAEQAVLEAVVAMAAADGDVADAEVSVIGETLRRMFGRAPSEAVDALIRATPAPRAIPFDSLEANLTASQRQLLLMQMAEVAAVDGVVTQGERSMLDAFASRLQVPTAFVDAVLGGHLARADVHAPVRSPTACPGCAFDTPPDAAFCPSCGVRLR